MSSIQKFLKRYDTYDTLEYRLETADGFFAIPEGSTVRFRLKHNGGTLLVDKQAEIDNLDEGRVSYRFQDGDLLFPGKNYGEFTLETQEGKIKSFPETGFLTIITSEVVDTGQEVEIIVRVTDIQEYADYAKEQGDYAKEQGDAISDAADTALMQSQYAEMQGDYAKEQGDYAKERGDYTDAVISESLQSVSDAEQAEQSRKDAESTRVQSEQYRSDSEQIRVDNESNRQSNESDRQYNESLRYDNESDRVQAESDRNSAESQRQSNEQDRQYSEVIRQKAYANVDGWENVGEYDPTINYSENNIVTYNGSTFQSRVDGNEGNTPNRDQTTAYWSILARRGIDGEGSVASVNNILPDGDGDVSLVAGDIGAYTKPETDSKLDDKINESDKGVPGGIAELDSTGNVPVAQLGNVEGMESHGNEWHIEEFETVEGAQNKANEAESNANSYTDTQVSSVDTSWEGISGKPSEYPPESHSHEISDVGGLQTELNSKASSYALTTHKDNVENPHQVTASQVGAPTTTTFNNHTGQNASEAHEPILTGYREPFESITGDGSITLNADNSNVFKVDITAETTINLSTTNTEAVSVSAFLEQGATAHPINFPSAIKWDGGDPPDIAEENHTYILTFLTYDSGTTWLGFLAGEFDVSL